VFVTLRNQELLPASISLGHKIIIKVFWFRVDRKEHGKKVVKKANLSKEWGAKPPARQ